MIPSPQRARRRAAPAPFRRPPSTAPSSGTGTVIPYDYAATFELTGQPGNLVQDVINISQEGVFVAVAIGYGFEEDRGRPIDIALTYEQTDDGFLLPGDITLGQIAADALIEGFRVNPRFESLVFRTERISGRGVSTNELSEQPLSTKPDDKGTLFQRPLSPNPNFKGTLFEKVKPREEISFLFSLVDAASGRELQDEPTHNLASLGICNGGRPFRLLAQPLSFLPRSTLRLQVIERSQDTRGTLFIVLYGYKLFAAAGCPEPLVRTLRGPFVCPTESIGNPSDRVIPFDYVASVQLTGRPGNLLDTEIPINVEGGFVSTALGYGLAVDERDIQLQEFFRDTSQVFSLAQTPLRAFPPNALRDGIRIRPNFVRIAFQNNGELNEILLDISPDLANQIFESLNRPEDVSFRYTIFDGGSGRELQNQPLNNIAGLGIATGERPFKKFARPMIFSPRSRRTGEWNSIGGLRSRRRNNMYLYAREGLGQIPETLQPGNLRGPKQPPQCEAIPEKYKLRDSKDVTSGKVNCPTRADAVRILRTTIARAVEMLDNTIGELVRAREAACRGEPLGWPALGEVTACWLKYRLGVCIDDPSAWTKGAFRKSATEPTPVAEIIRRLVGPRNLLATNQIT